MRIRFSSDLPGPSVAGAADELGPSHPISPLGTCQWMLAVGASTADSPIKIPKRDTVLVVPVRCRSLVRVLPCADGRALVQGPCRRCREEGSQLLKPTGA